jgi:redox-sensing transcriptional repressor
MKKLPDKTIERLSMYRRNLILCLSQGKKYIYSHELANDLHITPVQVRRDIMLIGYSGTLRKGYDVEEMIKLIGSIIDTEQGKNVAVIGVGNLGKAIISYINGKRSKLKIVAAFDSDSEKSGKLYAGVRVFHLSELEGQLLEKNISIAILTVPGDVAEEIAERLIAAGIKGILNYTPRPLNIPSHIYLEEYDMITSIEKVAYHSKSAEEMNYSFR